MDPPCGTVAAWPVEQIAQTLHLDDAQRVALEALNDTAGAALETLRASCSQALPGTPIARMQALQARLSDMLQEIDRMRPALARFYAALNDTQREQLTASASSRAQCPVSSPALFSLLPVEAMARELRVDSAQRAALHDLQHALVQAGDTLQRQCAPTPPTAVLERFEQIEAQLRAALRAAQLIEPALAPSITCLAKSRDSDSAASPAYRAEHNRTPAPRQEELAPFSLISLDLPSSGRSSCAPRLSLLPESRSSQRACE